MSIYNTVIKSGGGTQIIQIPSAATTTFSYDGTEQSLSLTNYNPAIMTARNISATAAGNYTATFSLKDITAAIWSDNSTTDKTISWTINKASRSITLSKSSITLDKNNLSDTVSFSYTGDGIVSVVSSDTDVVDVSVSNNVITIQSVDSASGNETVTVSVTGSDNYVDVSAVIDVSAEFAQIFGVSWDGTSTTSWTRTDAAANFSDPVPYVSGATQYGSPFDNIMPWKGMTVSERTGGTMVAIPKFYYKLTQNGDGLSIKIADRYVKGYSVSPAHLRRENQTEDRDIVYIGRYYCRSKDFKSIVVPQPTFSTGNPGLAWGHRSTCRNQIHNIGETIWQMDFAILFTIWLLYLVEFANWDSQSKIGYGGCYAQYPSTDGASGTGYTDSMPYHTGTTKTSRTTYGPSVQYRNIEGLWDNFHCWIDGCRYNYNTEQFYIVLNPSEFSNTYNGTLAATIPAYQSYPTRFSVSSDGGYPIFYPIESKNGSGSTYTCDYFQAVGSSSSTSSEYDNQAICISGRSQSLVYGLFFIGTCSEQQRDIGCRLMELP